MTKDRNMKRTGKVLTQFGAPLGEWFTPDQRDRGFISVWNKLTREEFDVEDILKRPSMTYFNRPFAVPVIRCEYDQRYHFDYAIDVKSKTDTIRNIDAIREQINEEEAKRLIPLCTSQNYGHRKKDLEEGLQSKYKKRSEIKELLRRNYLNLKPNKKQPPDHTTIQL